MAQRIYVGVELSISKGGMRVLGAVDTFEKMVDILVEEGFPREQIPKVPGRDDGSGYLCLDVRSPNGREMFMVREVTLR